jgi:DNA-binding IclR family transcriptional regulator
VENFKLTPIEKAKKILEALCQEPYEFGASEISAKTGLDRSSVRRILNDFSADSWVIQDMNTKKYKIGPMLYHVGMTYANQNNAECKILEVLDRICNETKESIGYAVRVGDKVMSVYETELHQPIKLNYHPGQLYPINRGCYGKCLMAYHDRDRVIELLENEHFEKICPNTLTETDEILNEYNKIRANGYVISDEEVTQYLCGVGVPVFDPRGKVSSCIVIAFIKGPDFYKKITEYIDILKAGALEIGKYLL